MKKVLLSLFFMGGLAISSKIYSQCTVTAPVVTNVLRTTNPDNTTCTVKFDLSFTMQNNNGNKTIVIHLWPSLSYPNPALCYTGGGCGQPTAPQLSNSYGSIVIDNNISAGHPDPTFYATYPFRSGVTVLTADEISRAGGGSNTTPFQFTIKGITLLNQSCNSTIAIKGDIWSTNSGSLGSGTNPQCATSGLYLQLGDPTIGGFLMCNGNNPKTIDFLVSTTSTAPINATYKILRDDGELDDANQPVLDLASDIDVTLPGSTAFTVSSSDPFGDEDGEANNGVVGFTGNNVNPFATYDHWVLVTYTINGFTSSVAKFMSNSCTPLPVQFKSFNASRTTSSNVAITWTTAMEQNSKGFNVQKNVGGEWKTIAFVFSQAEGGNSSSDLSYSFKDVNNEKGITQYRIQQVDLDGMAKYSDIKAIRGESAASKIVVYPNPSIDGKLNVVFEDNSGVRDVQVADMQGRIVKSFKGITNNILVIEKLTSGFYTIKVTNRNTAASSVEKVVVK